MNISLIDYPRTYVKNNLVYIAYTESEVMVWGEEPNEEEAIAVAEDLQIGLQVLHYIQNSINKWEEEIERYLTSHEVPHNIINECLYEIYRTKQREYSSYP